MYDKKNHGGQMNSKLTLYKSKMRKLDQLEKTRNELVEFKRVELEKNRLAKRESNQARSIASSLMPEIMAFSKKLSALYPE